MRPNRRRTETTRRLLHVLLPPPNAEKTARQVAYETHHNEAWVRTFLVRLEADGLASRRLAPKPDYMLGGQGPRTAWMWSRTAAGSQWLREHNPGAIPSEAGH